jgi:signal transduction histidine kinase/CheY-like chemotaxis protein
VEIALQHIVPEDRAMARAAHDRAEQTGVLSYEARVRWPDGSLHWIAPRGRMQYDSAGRPVRIAGVVADITARKEAEQALHESERRARARSDELAALMNLVPAVVFQAHDPEARRITGSRKAHGLLRVPLEGNLSRSAEEPERPRHFHIFQNGVELRPEQLPVQRAAGGEPVYDQELEVRFDDGTVTHLYGNAVPVHDEQGNVRGALAAMIDITERKRAEQSLQDADRRKDEFLATLAHELRNPLAAIRMALHVLGTASDDPPQVGAITAIIERQSSQLVRLIDDLLDVSRISQGKIGLRRTNVDVGALIRQVVDDARAMFEEAGLELSADLPEEPIRWDADPVRFAQVVNNLLHNACKFTGRGGHVRVILEHTGDEAMIRVDDTGIGIAREQLGRIFDIFIQGDDQRSGWAGGLGIGLSLARSIMELHGGTIEARSDGPGTGSEFLVRLPGAGSPSRAIERDDQPIGHVTAPAEADPIDAHAERPPGQRILAADDNGDVLEVLAIILRLNGHDVRTAADGAEALEQARTHRPAIALLDIGMPGMDGYEVARRIRQEPWGREMLLVAMTGWGQERDRRQAQDAGFDVHLTKPVDPHALEQLIAAHGPRAPVPPSVAATPGG